MNNIIFFPLFPLLFAFKNYLLKYVCIITAFFLPTGWRKKFYSWRATSKSASAIRRVNGWINTRN